jgi:hypothetical protein
MAASISSVTTMGYSNGTFNGSIALVVTLGYGIGAAATVTVNDGWITESRSRVMVPESRDRVWIAKGKLS